MSVQMILYLSSRQRGTEEGESTLSEIKASSDHPLSHTHTTQNHSNRQFSSFPSHTHTHTMPKETVSIQTALQKYKTSPSKNTHTPMASRFNHSQDMNS